MRRPSRLICALAVLLVTAAALVGLDPLGPLRGPLLLVVALPIMARALSVIGWVPLVAGPFARLRAGVPAIMGTYAAWLAVSALLTLDVAAVVAVPVGLAVARRHGRGGRSQVAAAVVGANVGSLILPFSNLTNLVLVAGTGLDFRTYVGTAWLPQIAAAAGAGIFLARRTRALDQDARRRAVAEGRPWPAPKPVGGSPDSSRRSLSGAGLLAGIVAVGGAVVAIVVGFEGGDVATVLTIAAGAITGLAFIDGRLRPREVWRSISVAAVLVILAAVALREPISSLAAYLPVPDANTPAIVALPLVALVGGVLAATCNNLPAAAFGGIWLHGAGAPVVVAYLLGTNILALITPHGSVATMLGRTLAHRGGVHTTPRDYLRNAWRYALAGTVPALLVLVLVR